jgi:iron complex transport system permease protein
MLTGQSVEQAIWMDILWDLRMTKALTCILAGSSLAIGGLQMQTLFRNALAGPDVIGLSAGASLAVSLIYLIPAIAWQADFISGSWLIAVAASLGSAIVCVAMLAIARTLRDNVSLLIIGLMIAAVTSSVVNVLQYISRAEDLQTYIIWTFGSLGGLNWTEIEVLAIVLLTGVGLALATTKSLNAWLLGNHYAESIGINIQSSRLMIIGSTCLLTGGVTAFCGPIAFVGLAVPHLVKLLVKTSNHLVLIPAVMIGGASLLLFCDILSQLPGSSQILPINAITALIGAPVVIWVILRHRIIR